MKTKALISFAVPREADLHFVLHMQNVGFSDQFRKIIMRYKRIGYNLNVMRQAACLVINPITVAGRRIGRQTP